MTRRSILGLAALAAAAAAARVVAWASRWGSTAEERAAEMPGDVLLAGGPKTRVAMTRAVSIAVPPHEVWPWLAQMGRGAGWYSHDALDNGGRTSARHLVSWIPAPEIGDASAVGWLWRLEPGRALTWWMPGEETFGARLRMVVDVRLVAEGDGSRLVIRMSGDAAGPTGTVLLYAFRVVDSLMAVEQLKGIKRRAERFGTRRADPDAPETGERNQFQRYEVIWAAGGRAGVPGSEHADRWRATAQAAGVVGGS